MEGKRLKRFKLEQILCINVVRTPKSHEVTIMSYSFCIRSNRADIWKRYVDNIKYSDVTPFLTLRNESNDVHYAKSQEWTQIKTTTAPLCEFLNGAHVFKTCRFHKFLQNECFLNLLSKIESMWWSNLQNSGVRSSRKVDRRGRNSETPVHRLCARSRCKGGRRAAHGRVWTISVTRSQWPFRENIVLRWTSRRNCFPVGYIFNGSSCFLRTTSTHWIHLA